MTATVRYEATASFPLSSEWEVLLDDGTEVALAPVEGDEVLKTTLAAGKHLDIPLTGAIQKGDERVHRLRGRRDLHVPVRGRRRVGRAVPDGRARGC